MLRVNFPLLLPVLLSTFCPLTDADSGVTFTYPNSSSHLTVNYNDTVILIYSTPWPSVNIWVYCLASTNSQYADWYQTYGNPMHQSGILTIPHIGSPTDLSSIVQFPTPCWIKVADSRLGNADDNVPAGVVGANFTMKSVDSLPVQTWSAGVSPTSSNAQATVTVTATPGSSSQSISSNSGLNLGAKAGISVGVGILCVAVIGMALYAFKLRKILNRQFEEVKKLNALKASRDSKDANDERYTRKELPTTTVKPVGVR